MAVKQSWI